MSENEIKPVAWQKRYRLMPSVRNGYAEWSDWEPCSEVRYENMKAALLPDRQVRALYGQAAIDQLIAERDALRSQLDWVVRENDRLLDEGRDSAAERDAAVADAERYRWVRLRIGGREAVEDDFKWEYESGECLAQEVDAAIDAARAQERQ